ncbi:MAG: hypothetical protein O3A95_06400 [Planctomycetota bacterium]|nr:hypothetical protein [Planctomycetota bacterium]MDA1113912.1 hypothetical protein [Planctomycetota bacterium]
MARSQGAESESIEAFEHLLEHDSEDHAARLNLAQMLSWSGKYQASEEHFEYLLAHAKDGDVLETSRQGLADLAAWSGRHRQAYDGYLWQLKGDPESVASGRDMYLGSQR